MVEDCIVELPDHSNSNSLAFGRMASNSAIQINLLKKSIYIYIYREREITQYVLPIIYIAYHILRMIYCLLIAFDAHTSSQNGYGPGTRARGPKAAGPQAPAQQLLGHN